MAHNTPMATGTAKQLEVVDQLSRVLELGLFEAIGHAQAEEIVVFRKEDVPVGVEIPGILRLEIFDVEFARRALNYNG